MRPNRSFCAGFALLLYLGLGTSSVAQLVAARPAGLRLDVTARVPSADGQMQEIPLNDDSVLRTGDGVQIRLRVARDAYVYVIVYGSSESAIVLQPFSGKSEDAFMRAGEERIIPGRSRFLPLDRRAGVESFYAFASPAPVRLMSSLLVRMEARGDDRRAVAETLRSSHPETVALNFRHVEARSAAATVLQKSPQGATATNRSEAASGSSAPVIREVEEQGVLSEEGSRIKAFIGGNTTPDQVAGARPDVVAKETAEVQLAPPAAAEPEPVPGTKSGGWFSRLFGFETGESVQPVTEPSGGEVAPATTYALPGQAEAKAGSVSGTADVQEALIVPEVSPRPLVGAEGETGRELRIPEPAPADPGNVDPKLNVSVLDAIVASLGEMPERDRGGESAVERTSAATESGALPSATVMKLAKSPSTAPAPKHEAETKDTGSRPDSLRRASNVGELSGGGEKSPVAKSVPGAPAVEQPINLNHGDPGRTNEVALGPANPPEPASKTVVIGRATSRSPESSAPAVSAAITGGDARMDAATGPAPAPTPESSETSIFSGFASLFGGSSTEDTVRDKAPSAPAPPKTAPAAAADPTDSPGPPSSQTGSAANEVPAEKVTRPSTSSFFSGLTGWFSGSSPDDRPQKVAEVSSQQKQASPVVERPAPVEAPAAAAAPVGEGLFGGLSRLFGGDAGEPAKPDNQAPRPADTPQPVTTPDPEEPVFKTVTRADGKQVVIVPGPPGRPDGPPASSEVLAGEGSKIRALLEPEKAAVPQDNVVAEVSQQATAPAQSSPDQAAIVRSQPVGEETTIAKTPDDSVATASAASASTAAAAIAPDEVQAALEAGASAVRPPAETLAALTAPAPASQVSVAPVREIDVTAANNVSSSIVLVVTPTGTGSGVLVDGAGHVLTNWHLVNGYSTASVSFKSPNLGMPSMERTFSARVVRLNKTADLALLRMDSPPGDVFPVRFADAAAIKPGGVLHVIGHPASGAWTHTLGKIDDVKSESSWYAGRNLLHRGTVIQAKVLDDPGSAGAPLFNNRMEFVGISAVARSKKGVLTGVSVETIRLFLEAPPAGS